MVEVDVMVQVKEVFRYMFASELEGVLLQVDCSTSFLYNDETRRVQKAIHETY